MASRSRGQFECGQMVKVPFAVWSNGQATKTMVKFFDPVAAMTMLPMGVITPWIRSTRVKKIWKKLQMLQYLVQIRTRVLTLTTVKQFLLFLHYIPHCNNIIDRSLQNGFLSGISGVIKHSVHSRQCKRMPSPCLDPWRSWIFRILFCIAKTCSYVFEVYNASRTTSWPLNQHV